ncbi:MAG: AAA family ATPase, partial [Thermoleophilaceae bacterium]
MRADDRRTAGADGDGFDAEVRVRHVRYEAPDGDFAVLLADAADGSSISVAGAVAGLAPGTRARVVGRWTEHPQYGRQVEADAGYELDPDDVDGALKYLTTISRIGKKRARQLVDRHGPEVLTAIDVDPERAFGDLPGMGARAAAAAAESWRERRALRDLYVRLAPHGLGWLAGPLHERHGTDALGLVTTDAYRLTEEHRVGFATADAIARAHGVPPDSPSRYRAAAVHVLAQAEARGGHTYLPLADLRRQLEPLVGELAPGMLEDFAAARVVVLEDGRVALPATWQAEERLGDRLTRLAAGRPGPVPAWLADEVETLTAEQRSAVEAAFERRLSVVTGGPGTGKTTLVSTIARLAERAELSLALCAPTGRAARRLVEATGQPATTIHRLRRR